MNVPAEPIVIRPAVLDDVPSLLELETHTFTSDQLGRRSYRRFVSSTSALVLVAMAGARLAGAAVLLFRRGSRVARLYSLARHEAAEFRGLGGRLLAAAEEAARGHDCDRLSLEVQIDNNKALHLYERSGYRAVARLPAYYATGRDGVRMVKKLDVPSK